MLVTFWPKPLCCWPTTLKPSCVSACCTCWKCCPTRSGGICTSGGPAETETVTVEPGRTGVPGGTDWDKMMPCGWLLCTVFGCRVMLLPAAHCWIELMFCPTRVGSDRPATTSMTTGLFSGHGVPAAGIVPATEFSTTVPVTPTGLVVGLAVRPAVRSAASACASGCPATVGTLIIRGPDETVSTIVAPGSARPDGDAAITSFLGTLSSICLVPMLTWNPACRSSCSAAEVVIRSTEGTVVYRPDVSHQPPPPSPITATTATATYASRRLNSHRCRNGSPPSGPPGPPAWVAPR